MDANVVEAIVRFAAGADTRAPGGAVTVALCGHWDHDGRCRWPHHTAVSLRWPLGRVRVVYAAESAEQQTVQARIEQALRGEPAAWTVQSCRPVSLAADEHSLAAGLTQA